MTEDENPDMTTTFIQSPFDDDEGAQNRQAALLVLTGPTTGQTIYLEGKDIWTMGRSASADITFHEASVSRNHARLRFIPPEEWIIEDLNSSNGTWVNSQKAKEQSLQSGDRVQLGQNIVIKFVIQDEVEAAFQRELYESATKDDLTKVFSKGYFLEQLDTEFNFHRRINKPLSVVLADIDHFKKINDTHGHLAGDAILKDLGRVFLGLLRRGDLVGRYGGEEFIFVLRETPLPGAKVFAERLRRIVESHPFIYEGTKIPTTLSLGAATYREDNFKNPTALIKAADQFLYKAKKAGRNRVSCLMDDTIS